MYSSQKGRQSFQEFVGSFLVGRIGSSLHQNSAGVVRRDWRKGMGMIIVPGSIQQGTPPTPLPGLASSR